MTTAQNVFDYAMALMDEVSEATGETDTTDTKEYKNRTLFILNILRGELYPYSDTYTSSTVGIRPIAATIKNFTDPIGLDDYICQSILPYGLAAQLLLTEDPSAASFFNQRYEELKITLRKGVAQEFEDIADVYGGSDVYQEFGKWG